MSIPRQITLIGLPKWLTIFLLTLSMLSCQKLNHVTTGYALNSYGNTSVLFLSDIHFNPFCECQPNAIPCKTLQELIERPINEWPAILSNESINKVKEETNNAFLTQGIDDLAKVAQTTNARIMFITGDLLSHNFNLYYKGYAPSKYQSQQDLAAFSYKTILYVLQELRKKMPNCKIYMVLGNNDTDRGDYKVPSPEVFRSIADTLSLFVDNKQDFIGSFKEGSYFSTFLSDKVMLIGLNTNVLSAMGPNYSLAQKQLNWLSQVLAFAKASNKKVIFMQHIPYGIDAFKSAVQNRYVPLLDTSLQRDYLKLLKRYRTNIASIYAGHLHMEYFSIVDSTIPLIGDVAFNAFVGNNPGFKVLSINSDGTFNGYTTYYSNLSSAKLNWSPFYNFTQVYGQPSGIVQLLNQFPQSITDKKVVAYRTYYNGNNLTYPQPISDPSKWKYYHCAITESKATCK